MPDAKISTLKSEDILTALALLGRADSQLLSELLNITLSADDLVKIARNPAISIVKGRYSLAKDQTSQTLTHLEQEDLPRYRRLLERTISLLANRLQAGHKDEEPALMAAFERLANRLITDDPQRLLILAEEAQRWLMRKAANRQRCAYYMGVGLFEAERYNEALVVFDRLLSDPKLDSYIRGRVLNSRARCYQLLGRLGEALTGFRASLEHWRRLGNQHYEGIVLLNMGIVTYDLQNYDEAESYLRQAETIFETIGSKQWLGDVYNELGLIYRDRGQWSEALAHFEKYVAQRRAEGAEDREGRGLNNIGEVLLFQGRFKEALTAFQEALAKMTTRVFRIDTHMFMGLTYQAQGNLSQAEQSFREALIVALAIERRDILAEVHYRLGECLNQSGDPDAALTEFEAGAAIIEATREPLRDEGLKISLLGRWQQVYEALVLYHEALEHPAVAFAWAERARARAFTDTVLAQQAASSDVNEQPTPTANAIAMLAEIQAVLPADGVLLCYFTTGVLDRALPLLNAVAADNPLRDRLITLPRIVLFVVTGGRLTVHQCPLDPNLLSTVSPRGRDHTRFLDLSVRRQLYQALFGPVEEMTIARRCYIIPHGPLHHVPFEALIEAAEEELPLVISYTPSATLLARHAPLPTSSAVLGVNGCLAIGYNSNETGRSLSYTEPEAKMVAQLMGGRAWVGSQPKLEQLQPSVSQQRWLHFACHGSFNHEHPLESYLEIAEGERLTAFAVLERWQLKAELVVLSACHTGVSRVLRGDEPFGLIRAFLTAGAKAMLVSRWPVEDLPAFLLMSRFYQSLGDEASIDVSVMLHVAQRWLRGLTVARVRELQAMWSLDENRATRVDLNHLPADSRPFDHPKFWAAFMIVGGR
ncbi:MAG: CHAT domain-containing protein [Anaerolineales bacterium]|nr:CHAT domain-containing protein [Anaerolineales bacterium]